MADTRAFVAGATGYTGREVVRLLCERGIPTVAHVRPDSSRLADWRSRFEAMGAEVDTTAWEEPAMTATLTRLRPTLLFSLLGTTRARGKEAAKQGAEDTYETIDYGLTALLRRAAEAAGRETGEPPRFVYLSAVGVRPDTGNAYLAARARVERELAEGDLPYTIARPSFITGSDREGRSGEKLAATVGDGLLAVAGALGARRLRDRFQSMTGEEMAAALVRIALDPACVGQVVEGDGLRASH